MSAQPPKDLLARWSVERLEAVEAALGARFADAWPPRFAEACRYPLSTGGKRIRPLLCLAAAESLGAQDTRSAVGAAAALELVHTYSLVHDDLPCMDDDAMRRGKPTVHVAFGENSAVLVGDALLTEAFRLLARLEAPAALRVALVDELAEAAGHVGMIGGQAADIGLGGPVRDLETLLAVHRGKTGALIRAACRMGARCGGASAAALDALSRYGEAVGLLFQLADDVLDAEQDAAQEDGGPPSTVSLLGLDETRRQSRALLEAALAAVAELPDPSVLVALARFALERDH